MSAISLIAIALALIALTGKGSFISPDCFLMLGWTGICFCTAFFIFFVRNYGGSFIEKIIVFIFGLYILYFGVMFVLGIGVELKIIPVDKNEQTEQLSPPSPDPHPVLEKTPSQESEDFPCWV